MHENISVGINSDFIEKVDTKLPMIMEHGK